MLISEFLAQLDGLIGGDNSELAQVDRYRAVRGAVERYSHDRPDKRIDDVTGAATRYYELATALTDWSEGFSRVLDIEYPAHDVEDDAQPQYLDGDDWRDDYWAADKRYLYLPNHAPAATETMRVTYSVPWTWTASTTTVSVTQAAHGFAVNDLVYLNVTWKKATDTRLATHKVATVAVGTPSGAFTAYELQCAVPAGDFFAVGYMAASIACQAMAAKYAKGSESNIGADSVSRVTNSGEFSRRAMEFRELYEHHLGMTSGAGGESKPVGAGRFLNWETTPGWPYGARRYVFHRRPH